MKPWKEIKWPASRSYLVLKFENDFWRWWQEQAALEEKSAAKQRLTHSDQAATPALMIWSDDGGPGA